MSQVEILDCTLRDGSYEVEFQFTAEDTALFCRALESVGIRLIEIGHGLGLGASRAGKGQAAASDVDYMRAAADALSEARWGMFFIPGIGELSDVELAAEHGMHFLRVGTNASEVEASRPFVERAKELGLEVCANLMKSYALEPAELLAQARKSAAYGADMVALVDSAGCMLPAEVRAYVSTLREGLDVPLGFHGHDNLSLGIANVIAATEAGCTRVDTTMQGIGRGAGNAVTELVVAVLGRQGVDLGIDLNALTSLSERLVRPLLHLKGWDAIDITSGVAGFHSSHLALVRAHAEEAGVDPRELIVELCKVDQIQAPPELVREVAARLAERSGSREPTRLQGLEPLLNPASSEDSASLTERVRALAGDVRARARKLGQPAVLNLVVPQRPRAEASPSRFVQEGFGYVIGSVEASDPAQIEDVVRAADGLVDHFLVDADRLAHLSESACERARAAAQHTPVHGYRDNDVWLRSVERLVAELLGGLDRRRVVVAGVDALALGLALRLADRGAALTLTGASAEALSEASEALARLSVAPTASEITLQHDGAAAAAEAEVLIGFERLPEPVLGLATIAALPDGACVVDAGIGAVASEAFAHAPRVRFYRPDMRAELAAEVSAALGAARLKREAQGVAELDGVRVVGGGVIGRAGDVILDSIRSPSRVVGIADGSGRVLPPGDELAAERLARVRRVLLQRQLSPQGELDPS